MQAKILRIQQVYSDLKIFTIEPQKVFKHKAGQYLMVFAQGYEPRPYSIASAPNDDNTIELHIRAYGGLSSFLCDTLNEGDMIDIEGPLGSCTYKAQCKKLILALAGGTGLAPMKAIIEKALSTKRDNPVYLYHGAKDKDQLYLNNTLTQWAQDDPRLVYRPVVSHTQDSDIPYGFLNEHIAQDFESLKDVRCYMSGPPEMLASLRDLVLEKKIDEKRIHFD